MHWTRLLGIVLIVIGVGLLVFGFNATESIGEELRQEITGTYSDQTTWYLIGGAASGIVGILLVLFGARR